jgi:predicted metalloprotease with PDZ domain
MLISTLLLASLLGSPPSKDSRLEYNLRFDPADTTSVSVRLLVRNAPISIVVAAHAHPEYDDKYWRYVEDLRAQDATGQPLTISRIDSVRWQIGNRAGDITITYRVKFPEEQSPRASWRPFLSPTGGLIGGPHSFLYIVGLEKESADVTLDIPAGWKVGSGLDGPSSARHFTSRDVHTLMESPILVGNLSEWRFSVRNVPHRIFYWHLPEARAFDSAAFVSGIEKIATQAIALFGSAPYHQYSFLFQDGAWEGGLEHPNSVTLGARSEELAKDPVYTVREAAHEFIHTWNLMAIQPAEYREVDYRVQPPVAELWFSEGLTIFYADLLRRRAGIPVSDSTRISHLEQLIGQYLSMPGNARFSAEQISNVAYNASPGALGDYTASSHLVGEILGAILDVRIRDATNGAKSMDDVMRLMFNRFSEKKFTSRDVQRAADDVCACSTAAIFDRYVFNAGAIDFNRYLEPLGLRADVAWKPAVGSDGRPQPDVRVWGWAEGDTMRLRVSDPNSVWAKAGLHTGDRIISVNGSAVRSWPELRTVFRNLAIGDSVLMVVQRGANQSIHRLTIAGYQSPRAVIRPIARRSAKQSRLLRAWMAGR